MADLRPNRDICAKVGRRGREITVKIEIEPKARRQLDRIPEQETVLPAAGAGAVSRLGREGPIIENNDRVLEKPR
jgi:hypothetical protein